jgi:acyl-CoA synthetase (NDP forming)
LSNALQRMLSPKSIAIVGVSSDFNKLNGRPFKFLLDKGYAGTIYPVNPKYDSIEGIKCYASIADLPEPADLAVVAVPAKFVLETVRQLGVANVPSAVIFSSGFGEMGAEGKALEEEVAQAARDGGVRICGPNGLGLINAFEGVMATFSQYADADTPAGPVGFVTQSGAFGTAIAALARRRNLGFGLFLNTGNEADVDFVTGMSAVLDDPRITVGAGYIEGLKDGNGLAALAEQAMADEKPLVVTKVGRFGAGARAAASHTGSLAGEDAIFDGVVRQLGLVRARNEENMLDMVQAFAHTALPAGRGIGIVTQSGGAGVLMADRAEELGLEVPRLSAETTAVLEAAIPAFGATGNPVDVTGQFLADPKILLDSVNAVLEDPSVDIAVVWLQLMEGYVDLLIDIFRDIKATAKKPFIVCWVAASDAALARMSELGIATMRGADPTIEAISGLVQYREARDAWRTDHDARQNPLLPSIDLPRGSGVAPTVAAAKALIAADIPLTRHTLCRTVEEACVAAKAIGYPVAMKIESLDLPHKTEAGGVMLGLADEPGLCAAYHQIIGNAAAFDANANIDGVIVQEMAKGTLEIVVGLKHDPVFGSVVMAGIGGVFVEVLRDVVFRRAPVTQMQALEMLNSLNGAVMLDGVRGSPPVDKGALADLIAAVSRFGASASGRIQELDLNPVLAGPEGATVVDWLMVMGE